MFMVSRTGTCAKDKTDKQQNRLLTEANPVNAYLQKLDLQDASRLCSINED